jgi:predicted RNase H-like HicB family nuclease
MAVFRADHYLVAEFEDASDFMAVGNKVLEALKEVDELKDLAIVTKRMEGKSWAEILGRIDVSEGSKAFWAMIKKDVSEREPFNLFIRLDRNAEGNDIEAARAAVKKWAESEIVPKIESKTKVKSIKVLQPNELYMPELS